MERPQVAPTVLDGDALEVYPMTEHALDHLAEEERRLSGISRQIGPDGGSDETPDSASIAEWLRDTESLDRRLAALRSAVAAAEVVAEGSSAVIGREVQVADDGEEDTYRLVIPGAGDPGSGAISIASPLGGALLGASAGDEVRFDTPAGTRHVRVVSVGPEAPPF